MLKPTCDRKLYSFVCSLEDGRQLFPERKIFILKIFYKGECVQRRSMEMGRDMSPPPLGDLGGAPPPPIAFDIPCFWCVWY